MNDDLESMGVVVMMCGIPGSGKSDFASRFPARQVLCLDTWREMMCDDINDQKADAAAVRVREEIAVQRMSRRLTTVIDATNARHDQRSHLIGLARGFGMPVVAVVLDYSVEVCMNRQVKRGRIVGKDLTEARHTTESIHRSLIASLPKLHETVDIVLTFSERGIEPAATALGSTRPDIKQLGLWCGYYLGPVAGRG